MRLGYLLAPCIMVVAVATTAWGQNTKGAYPSKGPSWYPNPTDSSYKVTLGLGLQFWYRWAQQNPGTVNAEGKAINQSTDFAVRRGRVKVAAQLGNKWYLYTQLGTNNMSFNQSATNVSTPKPSMFIHDFFASYAAIKHKLNLGAGLHFWSGTSRLSSVSYGRNFLLDNPTFNFPHIQHTDREGRQLGVFANGRLWRLHYRLSYAKPFYYDGRYNNPVPGQAVEIPTTQPAIKGYAHFNFFDTEDLRTPFYAMTYLGKKKLLNIGGGFYFNPQSSQINNANGTVQTYNQTELGIDVLAEIPVLPLGYFTFYSVFYHYDFGPHFVRSGGKVNLYDGGSHAGNPLPQGGGVKEFTFGTGQIFYAGTGLLLPNQAGQPGKWQAVAAVAYKNLQALAVPTWQFDVGLNYFMAGHRCKLSVQASQRNIYAGTIGPRAVGIVVQKPWLVVSQLQLLL